MKTLVLIRGLPGAGKMTFAQLLTAQTCDAVTICADDYIACYTSGKAHSELNKKALDWCFDQTARQMQHGTSLVVVYNTLARRVNIVVYQKLAWLHNYQFFAVEVTDNYENVHTVPAERVEEMRRDGEVWP